MKHLKLIDYQSPRIEMMTVVSEGLMCTSTKGGVYFESPYEETIYEWEE